MNAENSAKAFTLVELLVGLAIVAIALSIILPAVAAVVRSGWKSTVSEIGSEPASTPTYARQERNQAPTTPTLHFQSQAGLIRAMSILSTNGFSADPATGYLISTQ